MPARTFARTLSLLLVALLVLSATIPTAAQEATPTPETTPEATTAAKGPIVVASKDFSESVILGKMFILLLREAGFTVDDQTGLGGSPAVRTALENGEIDLYPEYTGTAVSLFHNLPGEALPSDADRLFSLAKSLDAEKGLVWLDRATFNNTYTLMVRQETVDQGIVTIADLADYMNANDGALKICVESEFYAREQDGLKGLEARYGFAFPEANVLFMDVNETYEALRRGDCEVAEGFATDGRIPAWGFQNLQDTLSFFPIYNPAPVIRQATLDQYPEIGPLLAQLGPVLDDATMSQLNARADIGPDGVFGSGDEEDPESVALSFLQGLRLIKPPTLAVGSKDFTEQLLLGKMLVLLLQDAGYEVEDQTGLGGSPAVRAALEAGEIDLYPEYTGTALSLHHGLPVTALPTDPDRAFELAKSLDERFDLVWLNRAQLNDTYTLMVRQEMIDLGITTIDDLAAYMNENDSPFTICVESEFYAREQDGLKGLEARYGFAFKEENVLFMDVNETYNALREGQCDVAEGFSTDGRIDAWDLATLEDTLSFFPIYNPAPVIRKAVLDQMPELADLLNPLGAALDNATMSNLNARVDLGPDGVIASGDEETVENVAYSFLRGQRLLKPPTLVVASKDYTEQLILGEMAALVLIDAGYQVVDKVGMGGSKVVRDAMMAGEVDIYVELTGSALAVHNSLPGEALPTDPDRAHLLAKSLDAPRGIVWLARGPFNDTYSIMVREDLWNQGIQSLQDLADFMNANDSPLSICVENDFFGRAHDGLPAVEERYGFTFKPENIQLMELDQIYTAFRAGECDVAEGYSTDGRGVAWGFFNLADPEAVFPFYNPAAVVRQAVLSSNPELEGLLDGFVTLLDDATMSQLNARVDIGADGEVDSGDEETPEAVARDFLLDAGLIDPAGPAATPSTEAEGDAETPGEPSAQTESEPAATPAPASEEPAPESQVEAGSPITTTPPVTETVPLTATAEAAATTAPTVTEEAASTAEPPISEEPTATDEMTATETVTATDEATATGVLSPAGALVAQAPPTAVVVASADTPADLLLGQLYLQLLQEAGLPVVDRTALGSPPAVRAALEQGEIDLYPERTGRALAQIHGLPASVWPTDPGRSYALAQSLDQPQGFLWLNRGFFHGGLALLVPQALAGQGVETISDLAEHAGEETIPFKLCLDSALSAELLAELTAQYGFNLASEDLVQVPDGETYAGLRNGLCDMAVGQPIDGRVTAWQLSTLIDNRAVFPSDAPAPVIRQSVAAAFPEVAIVLASLDNVLDNATMSRATALFTLGPDGEAETGDEAPIADVARVLLCDANLLANCADAQSYTPEAPQAAEEAVFSETVISGAVVSETLIVAAAGQIVVRTPASNAVNARAQPNAQAEVVELVAASSALPAIGRTPDYLWLQILLPDGRTAWVFTSAVFSQSNEINGLPVVEG